MTDLPAWLQEIRDRADKATEGPWRKCSDWMAIDPNIAWHYVESAATGEVITGNYAYEDGGVRSKPEDAEFIIGARMDVPRLVELVGEMAWNLRNVTDQVQDACRSRMTPLSQCPEPSDDYCPTCPTGLRGECGAPRSLEALREYRGEVSSND